MKAIRQLCIARMQRRLNTLEFITFLTREFWLRKDDDSFCDKVAQQLYYIEPDEGDGD